MTNSKRKTVDTAQWPRGVFEVTEAEFFAARAEYVRSMTNESGQGAWQVIRYCNGWPFVGDMVKAWLKEHRAAELSTDAKFATLRAALG